MRRLSVSICVGAVLTLLLATVPQSANSAPRVRVGVASISTQYAGADFAGEAEQIGATGAMAIRIPAKWNLL